MFPYLKHNLCCHCQPYFLNSRTGHSMLPFSNFTFFSHFFHCVKVSKVIIYITHYPSCYYKLLVMLTFTWCKCKTWPYKCIFNIRNHKYLTFLQSNKSPCRPYALWIVVSPLAVLLTSYIYLNFLFLFVFFSLGVHPLSCLAGQYN